MKKRILSILLTLCMTLCLTPISVFAEEVGTEGSAAIQLGADALSVLSKNVNTLHGELSAMTEAVLQAQRGILPCLRQALWELYHLSIPY